MAVPAWLSSSRQVPREAIKEAESSLVRPPGWRRILPWKINSQEWRAALLTVIFPRRQNARRGEDAPRGRRTKLDSAHLDA
jgi:hypothetical protein